MAVLLLAVIAFGIGVYSLISGTTVFTVHTVRKEDDPGAYWAGTVIFFVLGVGGLVAFFVP